jgi:hypothetical protein
MFQFITDSAELLCNLCIEAMKFLSQETGMSYGLINILLFVILGPLSTLFFMASTLCHVFIKNPKVKK